jgi:hypothetical protein
MNEIFAFFSEPWSMQLATWTLKQIVSAIIQLTGMGLVAAHFIVHWLTQFSR